MNTSKNTETAAPSHYSVTVEARFTQGRLARIIVSGLTYSGPTRNERITVSLFVFGGEWGQDVFISGIRGQRRADWTELEAYYPALAEAATAKFEDILC